VIEASRRYAWRASDEAMYHPPETRMSMDVEINLRIPTVKEPAKDRHGAPINSADVRFIRRVHVPALPKPGALLQFETRDGTVLECEVNRADWRESKDLFVVYCKYSRRSIPADQYHALLADPDWEMRPLL
jgi:hypothetical protein